MPTSAAAASAEAIDRLLPQTQCERCGHPGCLPYAKAIAAGTAPINRCAPGGLQTIVALAALTGQAVVDPAPDCQPIDQRLTVRIDEAACIGCTKCILACPVDAIVGAVRHRHRVLPERCTGCELCLPPCPVDCITVEAVSAPWTPADAERARAQHRARLLRTTGTTAGSATVATTEAAVAESTATVAARTETRPVAMTAATTAAASPMAKLAEPDERRRRLAAILARASRPA